MPSRERERELELKFAVDDVAAARRAVEALTAAGLEAGPWRTIDVHDQYLDTPSRALARAGYGARLRHLDGRTLVTIKARGRGPSARRERRRGIHSRLELEGPANRRLRPQVWPQSAARSLVEATAAGEPLRTLFTLDQQREERDLLDGANVVATVSLDTANVRRFGREIGSFTTLEIESAAPEAADAAIALEALRTRLSSEDGLRAEERSKEEIAQQMVEHALARYPRPPRRPGITRDDLLAEAARKVLRMQLLRMLAAEHAVRETDEAEAVHKMRVATRRMRAAWRVFRGAFRPRVERRYLRSLRDVARVLGAVRDVDVQIERLAAHRERVAAEQADALAPLADELLRRRAHARAALLAMLASGAYATFVSDYRSFVETPATPDAGTDGPAASVSRVRDVVGGRTWRAYERVLVHDATLQWADVAELHALRIDGKRLRYTLEFFDEILGPGAAKAIELVTQLQDHLGALNDAHIAADLVRAWLVRSAVRLSAAQRQAAGAYVEASLRDGERLRRGFRALWRRLAGPQFRRRLALTVAVA